jgi:putative sigma-54 modulation protein
MMNALDETIEAILRQIRKNKTRLEKKLKEGAFVPAPEEEAPAEVEEHPEFRVRTKSFPVKPMSTEDAILQMLLLEHDFFLFCNPDTGALNLVYRRDDGDYGLIVPD